MCACVSKEELKMCNSDKVIAHLSNLYSYKTLKWYRCLQHYQLVHILNIHYIYWSLCMHMSHYIYYTYTIYSIYTKYTDLCLTRCFGVFNCLVYVSLFVVNSCLSYWVWSWTVHKKISGRVFLWTHWTSLSLDGSLHWYCHIGYWVNQHTQ